jgi:hypothetical protein
MVLVLLVASTLYSTICARAETGRTSAARVVTMERARDFIAQVLYGVWLRGPLSSVEPSSPAKPHQPYQACQFHQKDVIFIGKPPSP